MPGFSSLQRAGLALGLAALLMFGAGPARGQPDPQQRAEASAHLKRGAELIDAEDLPGALAAFEAAYRLVPSPNILHNFGIVYQGLGRKAAALEAFQRFLDQAVKAPPAAREHAQQAVQILRGQVAELQVDADVDGATIIVDGRTVGQTPQEKPIYLDPGPHQLSVEKPGLATVHAQHVQLGAGQRLTVPARLAALPLPAVPGAETTRAGPPLAPPGQAQTANGWQGPAAWSTTAVATVAAGVFATTLALRYHRFSDFNDKGCGTDNPALYGPECPKLLEQGNNAETWAKVSGVATGALGLGAALLFVTLPEAPANVSLRASASQLGLGLQGRF